MNLSYENECYYMEEINEAAEKHPRELIAYSEDLYKSQIAHLVEEFGDQHILLLAGPSSSGKTTTAHRIETAFQRQGREVEVLSLDDFYKNRSTMPIVNGKRNFEVVESYEISLVKQTILELLERGETSLPSYDFATGTRTDKARRVTLPKNGVILLEGIHALSPQVLSAFPENSLYHVYISPHSGFMKKDGEVLFTRRQMRRIRRTVRDVRFRSSSADTTMTMWTSVCEAEDLYIRPSVKYAHFIINTTHPYEPCLLRDPAIRAFSEVPVESVHYQDAQDTVSRIAPFVSLAESEMPADSMMREFLG